MTASTKLYIEIVNQIRLIISNDGLIAGDKIPSERELADRLGVGRSSVREALRALELLGLIETRRGEGTFIKEFGNHQLINILGMFILQDEQVKLDLIETKRVIEKECIRKACGRIDDQTLNRLLKAVSEGSFTNELFLKAVIETAGNKLMLRIWLVLNQFYADLQTASNSKDNQKVYKDILLALHQKNSEKALAIYLAAQMN